MQWFILLLAVAISLPAYHADVNVTDYVNWKKADIKAWHQFFPSRLMEEERLAISAAGMVVNSLECSLSFNSIRTQKENTTCGLKASLGGILAFQSQELETAQLLMAGTDAEGCVSGIGEFINKAINDETQKFDDCVADTWSKIYRLNNTWNKVMSSYLTAYQRALRGIDVCAKTYPNKDSIDRLKSCVESMNKNYFVAVNNTKKAMIPSPIMTYFQDTVVQCASQAALRVANKGSQFLKMLVECAALSGSIDTQDYAEELSKWKGYNDTLASQISDSQTQNHYQVGIVEAEMQNYYNLQKHLLEQYIIESRGRDFYLDTVYWYLRNYYNTITGTLIDNPGDSRCADIAKAQLDKIASLGADKSLSCDLDIVNNTKTRMFNIYNDLSYLNNIMTGIGNAAILECFSRGYVFAPDTISACYRLVYSKFTIIYSDQHTIISRDIDTVSGYVKSFFSGSNLPCGGSSIPQLYLGGENVLYNLHRCLYMSSGSTYSVTTPRTPTTTEQSTNSPSPV